VDYDLSHTEGGVRIVRQSGCIRTERRASDTGGSVEIQNRIPEFTPCVKTSYAFTLLDRSLDPEAQ
jgi:hypothetical protein